MTKENNKERDWWVRRNINNIKYYSLMSTFQGNYCKSIKLLNQDEDLGILERRQLE
jgi:hypothetical protein